MMNDGQNPGSDSPKVPTLVTPYPTKDSPEVNKSNKIAMSPRDKRLRSLSNSFDTIDNGDATYLTMLPRSRSVSLSPQPNHLKNSTSPTPSAPPTTPELSHEDVSQLDTARVERSPNTLRRLGYS